MTLERRVNHSTTSDFGRLWQVNTWFILWVITASGCVGEPPAPAERPIESLHDATAVASQPDWGLTRETGRRSVRELPSIKVAADAIQRTADGTFVRVSVPDVASGVTLPDLRQAVTLAASTKRTILAPSNEGLMLDNPWFYVKLPAGQKPPQQVIFSAELPAGRIKVGSRIEIVVELPEQMTQREDVRARFLESAVYLFETRTGLFDQFAAGRLRRILKKGSVGAGAMSSFEAMGYAGESRLLAKLMSNRGAISGSHLSGAKAKKKAQADPARPGGGAKPTNVSPLPSEAAELLARVPTDSLVLFTRNLSQLSDTLSRLEDPMSVAGELDLDWWHLYDGFTRRARPVIHAAKMLHRRGYTLARLVGFSQDPAPSFGADITVIAPLRAAVNDADILHQLGVNQVDGVTLQKPVAMGGGFFASRDGDFLYLSNQRDQAAPLSESKSILHDAHFSNHSAPVFDESKSFNSVLFLGYPGWSRFISPDARFRSGRLRQARSELLRVQFAFHLFEWFYGREPEDKDEHLRSGFLRPSDLVHTDGRGGISWGAHPRSVWGQVESMNSPSSAVEPFLSETYGYQRLKERHRVSHRRGLRPMSLILGSERTRSKLRFSMTLGARPLPTLDPILASTAFQSPSPLKIFDWSVSLPNSRESPLRNWLKSRARELSGRGITFGWAGPWIQVGLVKGDVVWHAAQALLGIPNRGPSIADRDASKIKSIARWVPFALILPVDDWSGFHREMKIFEAGSKAQLDGLIDWSNAGAYKGVPVRRGTELLSDPGSRVSIFWAGAGDKLVVALTRDALEKTVDELVAAKTSTPLQEGLAEGVFLFHDESASLKTLAGMHFASVFKRRQSRLNRTQYHPLDGPLASPHTELFYGTAVRPAFPPLPTSGTAMGRSLSSVDRVTLRLSRLTGVDRLVLTVDLDHHQP